MEQVIWKTFLENYKGLQGLLWDWAAFKFELWNKYKQHVSNISREPPYPGEVRFWSAMIVAAVALSCYTAKGQVYSLKSVALFQHFWSWSHSLLYVQGFICSCLCLGWLLLDFSWFVHILLLQRVDYGLAGGPCWCSVPWDVPFLWLCGFPPFVIHHGSDILL